MMTSLDLVRCNLLSSEAVSKFQISGMEKLRFTTTRISIKHRQDEDRDLLFLFTAVLPICKYLKTSLVICAMVMRRESRIMVEGMGEGEGEGEDSISRSNCMLTILRRKVSPSSATMHESSVSAAQNATRMYVPFTSPPHPTSSRCAILTPHKVQNEAQPPKTKMDQSLPQIGRQRDGRGQHPHLRRSPQRPRALQPRPRGHDAQSHGARQRDPGQAREGVLQEADGGQ